jgi:DNA-3-methyladenine glycosylase
MLGPDFFDRDSCVVARDLLGKVLRRRVGALTLSAAIVEAEAYYQAERGSHASLGRTPSREPLFMPAGTIYMYHSRGGDSLNVSCRGEGNAVLLKSGRPYFDALSPEATTLPLLHANNPRRGGGLRDPARLCAGQALLCRALALRVREHTGTSFALDRLYVDDVGYRAPRVYVMRRLGIPLGRDEHLPYRFVDGGHLGATTVQPTLRRGAVLGRDYELIEGA